MARFAPLPIVSIDPRNEAELVQSASQRVYEASNRTLNDFSAGNPLSVLIEGQAFAQGEFLFWANQLPQKILIEWIGPFLGAMRRMGTPAAALLEISISPRDVATVVPVGTTFSTNPQLTGGVSLAFITSSALTIPAGEFLGKVPVYSKFVGSFNNCPANSITVSTNSGSISYEVTNPQPAVGGSDIETFQEVQERFFNLIRRPNPVSSTDWQNFFIDLYGVGTLTSVQPNRSSSLSYNYDKDYIVPNGQVAFFVLGPNGVELTQEQLRVGQNVINFSVPIENRGHLFPITLSPVQYNISLEVDANGTYGANFKESSLNFRDRLAVVLSPGSVFPSDINPTVSDIDAAFYGTIEEFNRYKNPSIVSSRAYNTPNGLNREAATYTSVYEFEPTESLINQNDLISVYFPNQTFFPAQSSFTPYSTDKFDQTVYGNLTLKQIRLLSAGSYLAGDIVYYDGSANPSEQGLHVVLENLNLSTSAEIPISILSGKISGVKSYTEWEVGTNYVNSENGTLNPDIVQYDYSEGEFIPASPSTIPLNQRPGAFAWLVSKNFALQPATNDITGAQAEFLLGAQTSPSTLEEGLSYTAGQWVATPLIGSGPNATIDPYYNYVDVTKGAIVKYAFVNIPFTYSPDGSLTSDYFNSLIEEGIIKEVLVLDGNQGLPIYKYKARFEAGQYLEFKPDSGSESSYYIAAKCFTPTSSNIQDLLNEGVVYNIAPSYALLNQLKDELNSGIPGKIRSLEILDQGQGYVDGFYEGVPLEDNGMGMLATANIQVSAGKVISAVIKNRGQNYSLNDILTIDNSYLGGVGSGVAISVKELLPFSVSKIKKIQRMFTFFAGDRTFFREGQDVKSYTATQAVTPLYNFNVYKDNGIFIESHQAESYLVPSENYIPFYNPAYLNSAEDTIVSEGGKVLYRVTRAFTPAQTVVNWTGLESENSARYEEYSGNLLRYVTMYSCEDEVLPQLGKETSSIRLGVSSITIIPKNTVGNSNSMSSLNYVWEDSTFTGGVPELSWYPSTQFKYTPPNYGSGTLAL